MNKTELIEALSDELESSSKAEVTRMYDALTRIIVGQLKNGERVQLQDIGILEVGNRAARKGRNPQTGEEIEIKASRVAKFKASKKLKDTLQD